MAGQVSGARAEAFCAAPDPDTRIVLICSADEGLARDAALTLLESLSKAIEPLRIERLSEDDLKSADSPLEDRLTSRSLLGDRSAYRLPLASERASAQILKALERAATVGDGDHDPIVIEAGLLKKSSKLRSAIADMARGKVINLAAESAEDVMKRVSALLAKTGVDITHDALSLFAENLPSHRALANQEIEKLRLYADNIDRTLTIEDIGALTTADADAAVYGYSDAVFSGALERAHATLDRMFETGTSPISLLRSLDREARKLLAAQALKAQGMPEGEIGAKLKPPVFGRAWPGFSKRLSLWPAPYLIRTLERLGEVETMAKQGGDVAEALVRELTTALCQAAAR